MAEKKNDKSFEESLTDLESIVKELEEGNVDLDKAIEKYSDAMKLAKNCSDKLNNATEKVKLKSIYFCKNYYFKFEIRRNFCGRSK